MSYSRGRDCCLGEIENNTANTENTAGRYGAAQHHYDESARLFSAAGNRQGQADAKAEAKIAAARVNNITHRRSTFCTIL